MRAWSLLAIPLAGLLVSSAVAAQSASLKAAPTAEVGSKLEVHWTGPAAQGDFVSIDAAGAPDHTYGPYAYPSAGNPVSILVPTTPGKYELRYHTGAGGYPVLTKVPLTVTDVAATLEAAASIEVAGSLKVKWTGPDNQGDFISIDPAGANDRTYGNYA
jgi:Ca-activated chloride channel family protein